MFFDKLEHELSKYQMRKVLQMKSSEYLEFENRYNQIIIDLKKHIGDEEE